MVKIDKKEVPLKLNKWSKKPKNQKSYLTRFWQLLITLFLGGVFLAASNYISAILNILLFVLVIFEVMYVIIGRITLTDIFTSTKSRKLIYWMFSFTVLVLALYVPQEWGNWTKANNNTTPDNYSDIDWSKYTNETQRAQPASSIKEIEPGDILNEINSRRNGEGLSQLEYSAVLQNIAQNLAIFNYQNPSIPISETVLEEYFNGQDYYPAQSAFQALTDVSCFSNAKTYVDRWYSSSNNYLNQRFKEIGIYIGITDNRNCNIFITLARP